MHKIANHSQYFYAEWGEAKALVVLTCSCGYEAYGDDHDPNTAYRQALEHFGDHIALVAKNRDGITNKM